jgi:SAM-dependent methyltransferase
MVRGRVEVSNVPPVQAFPTVESVVDEWLPMLRCPGCGSRFSKPREGAAKLRCVECEREFPIRAGTLRMQETGVTLADSELRGRTASSFAFEWQHFGAVREEWERNFLDYMSPHDAAYFSGLRVLDAGTGSGRHARQAALYGADVAAVDLGDSIDVARANVPPEVLTVQADLEALPFAPETFDLVLSLGVLHHLPDTQRALSYLCQFARPGGHVRVYLYWQPAFRWHRVILKGVDGARVITTRLPHRVLKALCYPLSVGLWGLVVAPYRRFRDSPRLGPIVDRLPLKTYADYPFGVLVNDQFDRFSAPIERRYTMSEVEQMMLAAGLRDVTVMPNAGWVAEGVVPASDA